MITRFVQHIWPHILQYIYIYAYMCGNIYVVIQLMILWYIKYVLPRISQKKNCTIHKQNMCMVCVYVYVWLCVCVCVCVCVFVCVCVCVCVCEMVQPYIVYFNINKIITYCSIMTLIIHVMGITLRESACVCVCVCECLADFFVQLGVRDVTIIDGVR